MSAKVYCFVSAKGGSGKTSFSANIAKFVSAIGRKCLLVDCDPATHGLTLLYLSEVANAASPKTRRGLFDLDGSEKLSDELSKYVVILGEGVDLFPASYRSESSFNPTPADVGMLSRVVDVARKKYDIIILDAQAGSEIYAREAMSRSISDEVVIVSEYDPLSAAGVEIMKRSVGDDLAYARTWILINKILPEFVKEFSEFMSIAKYLPPVPWDIDVVRAYARRQLAFDLDRTNDFTLALIQTSRRLLESVCSEDIAAWMKKRAYTLKAPILNQLKLAEEELKQWEVTKKRSEHKRKMRTIFLASTATYIAVIPFSLFAFWPNLAFFQTLESALASSAVMAGLALIAVFITTTLVSRTRSVRQEQELDHIQRQIAELHGRCNRLRALADADDESLIREAPAAKVD